MSSIFLDWSFLMKVSISNMVKVSFIAFVSSSVFLKLLMG